MLRHPRSGCPLGVALDLIGDRWTLLVVRDMVLDGKSRYGEFLESSEGISTNILADRLKRLDASGIAVKVPDDEGGAVHYRLTRKGADLLPVMLELLRWSIDHEQTGAKGEFIERLRRNPRQVERELRRRLVLADD